MATLTDYLGEKGGVTTDRSANGRRVLFMPNAKVLAHAGRSLIVGQALRERFSGTIAFGGIGGYAKLIEAAGFQFYDYGDDAIDRVLSRYIDPRIRRRAAIPSPRKLLAVAKEIVRREVELYRTFNPDVIVWDSFPSVLTSAEILGIPVIGIMHAFNTPYNVVKRGLPKGVLSWRRLPVLRLTRWVPRGIEDALATILWATLRRLGLLWTNRFRAAFHLHPLGSFEDGFRKLRAGIMPDLEILAPTAHLPSNFHYVGPLVWQPPMEVPGPLQALEGIIYVTMGSTGDPETFGPLLRAFARMLDIPVVMAVGDLLDLEGPREIPRNVYMHSYLPGTEMAKRARLIIYHGGAGTMYQALSQGVPVIGIPFTPVQELVGITQIEELGAGRRLYPWDVTPEKLTHTITEILSTESFQRAAQRLAAQFRLEEGPQRAVDIILQELAAIG